MRLIIKLSISTIAIFVTAYIVPGVKIDSFVTAAVVAIVLGVLNIFVKPILVILTLPINILTLGLFMIVINAFLVFIASLIVPGFSLSSVLSAIIFSLIFSLANSFLYSLAD